MLYIKARRPCGEARCLLQPGKRREDFQDIGTDAINVSLHSSKILWKVK
jgi:hypothetical protein